MTGPKQVEVEAPDMDAPEDQTDSSAFTSAGFRVWGLGFGV